MSGPKRNPDKLNTIGVVVVGICGAVLVYVSIVALQAFYQNDTSEVQNIADYGGQETAHQSLRATQTNTIEECAPNGKPQAGQEQTYRIPIKYAIKKIADEAKVDPSHLVPSQGRSDKPTILPIFGRPKIAKPAATDAPPGGSPGTPPVDPNAPAMAPTGGQGPGGGPQGTGPGTDAPTPENTGSGASAPKADAPKPPTDGPKTDAKTPATPGKNPPKTDAKTPATTPKTPATTPKTPATTPKTGSAAPLKADPKTPAAGSAAKPK